MIIHIPSIFQLPVGGTSDDTTAVQAVFDACKNAGGGTIRGVPGSTYTLGTVSVGSNTDVVAPDSTFQQKTANSNLFDLNGVSRVHFDKTNMIGTATPGGGISAPASSNNAINIRGNSSLVWVTRCDIREFLFFPVYGEQSTNIWVEENYLFENALGPRLKGISNAFVNNNRLDRTCLYSTTPVANQFSVGVGLESTDGHTFGICKDIEISGNRISGFPYAQGVLVHAGTGITIKGNRVNQSSIGISVNPYNTTDICSDITIGGNAIEGTNASSLPSSSGDTGVVVQGGPASGGGDTPIIKNVAVTGNTVHATNRLMLDAGQGGYLIGFTNGLTMSGNAAQSCGGNGFLFVSDEKGAAVAGNVAIATVAAGTTQTGFKYLGSPIGSLVGNTATDISGTNGIGYKVVGAATDLLWKDSGSNLLNKAYNCTTASA